MDAIKPHTIDKKALQSRVCEDITVNYRPYTARAYVSIPKAIIPLTMDRKMGLMTDRYNVKEDFTSDMLTDILVRQEESISKIREEHRLSIVKNANDWEPEW